MDPSTVVDTLSSNIRSRVPFLPVNPEPLLSLFPSVRDKTSDFRGLRLEDKVDLMRVLSPLRLKITPCDDLSKSRACRNRGEGKHDLYVSSGFGGPYVSARWRYQELKLSQRRTV